MRVMAKITIPVESGNQAVKDGSLGKIMQSAVERWKPEAVYSGSLEGKRATWMVFDLPDPSDIVPFAEPFFMGLNADVVVIPVMAPDDLQKGLAKLG